MRYLRKNCSKSVRKDSLRVRTKRSSTVDIDSVPQAEVKGAMQGCQSFVSAL